MIRKTIEELIIDGNKKKYMHVFGRVAVMICVKSMSTIKNNIKIQNYMQYV